MCCAGSFSPQRFTPYGALYGAPLQDDGVVWGRKDYSYTEPTAGKPSKTLNSSLYRLPVSGGSKMSSRWHVGTYMPVQSSGQSACISCFIVWHAARC